MRYWNLHEPEKVKKHNPVETRILRQEKLLFDSLRKLKQGVEFFFKSDLSLRHQVQEKIVFVDFVLKLRESSFDFSRKFLQG